jgi:DNA-binding MurR/RpiR family transcriptional regulator
VKTEQLNSPATHQGQFLETIRENMTSFSDVERRIARAILNDPASVINQSIGEFAAIAGVSAASAVRFCQALGLSGFQELKLVLTRTSPERNRIATDVDAGDSAETVSRKVVLNSAQALEVAADNIDHVKVARLADLIGGARRTLVVGVGTSAPLASDVAYRLALIGVDAMFAADAHVQNIMASNLTSLDVCLIVSHTGSTTETLASAGSAKASGATIVAVTSFTGTPLTDLTDLAVVAGSQETAYRVDAMTSRVVHLAVLDAIVVVLTHRSRERSETLTTSHQILVRQHRI